MIRRAVKVTAMLSVILAIAAAAYLQGYSDREDGTISLAQAALAKAQGQERPTITPLSRTRLRNSCTTFMRPSRNRSSVRLP